MYPKKKKTTMIARLVGLLAIQGCSGGILSDAKGEHRDMKPQRLAAPKDLGFEHEDVKLKNGVGVMRVRFKESSFLMVGDNPALGLTESKHLIPKDKLATVISVGTTTKRMGLNESDKLYYVSLDEPIQTSKSDSSSGDNTLTEGYVKAEAVEEISQDVTPTTEDPKIESQAVSGSCKVSLDLGTSSLMSKNGLAFGGLTTLSGPTFRSDTMDKSSAVVTLDKALASADIKSASIQLIGGKVVQGSESSAKPGLCAPLSSSSGGTPKLSQEFARDGYNTCDKMPEKALSKTDLASDGTFKASFKDLKLTANTWMGREFEVTAKVMVGDKEVVCEPAKLRLISPLVLDFSGADTLKTLSVLNSNVKFDLLGQGQHVKTGWISTKDQALLVMDLNGNGVIDSGRELFGDGTLLNNGQQAANGFAALSQYDSNHDGAVDAKDQAYDKLRLWFDRNQNGKTDAGELTSLASAQVKSIQLKYQTSSQANHGNLIDNKVLLEARFSGPKACGIQGCKVYDVYFGTISDASVVSK